MGKREQMVTVFPTSLHSALLNQQKNILFIYFFFFADGPLFESSQTSTTTSQQHLIPNFASCVISKHVPSRVRNWIAGQRRETRGSLQNVWELQSAFDSSLTEVAGLDRQTPIDPHCPPVPQPTHPPTPPLTPLHRLPLCSNKVKQPARQGRRCDAGSLICHLTKQPSHNHAHNPAECNAPVFNLSVWRDGRRGRVNSLPAFFQSWVSQPLH